MNTIKFVFLVLFLSLSSVVAATPLFPAIDSVIKAYISAEERQDYERVYNLFSVDMKTTLKQDIKINNSADYLQARLGSEAHWYNFIEKNRRDSKHGVIAIYSVMIEENGESEEVTVTIKFIRQNGEWKIDSIEY